MDAMPSFRVSMISEMFSYPQLTLVTCLAFNNECNSNNISNANVSIVNLKFVIYFCISGKFAHVNKMYVN